jgi:hypothetical protein
MNTPEAPKPIHFLSRDLICILLKHVVLSLKPPFSADGYTYVGGRREIYQWVPERSGEFSTAYLPGQQDV